jgi:37-kD nucleoid-associated bacterial protein
MINVQSAILSRVAVHYVGNKSAEESLFLSANEIDLSNEFLADILTSSFSTPFADKSEFFRFVHSSDLQLNEMHNYAAQIFENFDAFHEVSQHIASHLFEKTTHPKVKGGETYVALFENCLLDDELCEAIGVYKTENKDVFLKAEESGSSYSLEPELGINLNKIDKGCFIFNVQKGDGFRIVIIDNLNKGFEASYWKEDFLGLTPHADAYHYTKQYMNMTKDFVTKVMPAQQDTDRAEQIDFLNRSYNYFKENEQFEVNNFAETVITDDDLRDSFKSYRAQYQTDKNVSLEDNFDISDAAVKKQARLYKSVLKLDKNFHVYIHGDKELIEKGTDTDGRKFYKLYYENEQ